MIKEADSGLNFNNKINTTSDNPDVHDELNDKAAIENDGSNMAIKKYKEDVEKLNGEADDLIKGIEKFSINYGEYLGSIKTENALCSQLRKVFKEAEEMAKITKESLSELNTNMEPHDIFDELEKLRAELGLFHGKDKKAIDRIKNKKDDLERYDALKKENQLFLKNLGVEELDLDAKYQDLMSRADDLDKSFQESADDKTAPHEKISVKLHDKFKEAKSDTPGFDTYKSAIMREF